VELDVTTYTTLGGTSDDCVSMFCSGGFVLFGIKLFPNGIFTVCHVAFSSGRKCIVQIRPTCADVFLKKFTEKTAAGCGQLHAELYTLRMIPKLKSDIETELASL